VICGGPGCSVELRSVAGAGRPARFCSEACRKRAEREDRKVAKASDLVDRVRTVPTAVAVAALCGLSEPDLDRALAITAWKGSAALPGNTGMRGASGNHRAVIVTPGEDTSR
jgi:hypothetical protein